MYRFGEICMIVVTFQCKAAEPHQPHALTQSRLFCSLKVKRDHVSKVRSTQVPQSPLPFARFGLGHLARWNKWSENHESRDNHFLRKSSIGSFRESGFSHLSSGNDQIIPHESLKSEDGKQTPINHIQSRHKSLIPKLNTLGDDRRVEVDLYK